MGFCRWILKKIYIYFFFSLYVLNSSYLFIDDQPVFCKFNQTLVFFSSSVYMHKNFLQSFFFSSSSVCPLIEIHRWLCMSASPNVLRVSFSPYFFLHRLMKLLRKNISFMSESEMISGLKKTNSKRLVMA